jgi:hypothetical protein
MEPQEGAPAEGAGEPLFSDQIRLWLDEGDRLDAESGSMPIVEVAAAPGRFRRALRRLAEQAARHRLTVMAGVGLLPLALFAATHHPAALPATATATVAVVAAAEASPPPSSPVVHEREVISADAPRDPTVPVVATPPSPAALVQRHVAKRHHHHHHRLAQRTNGHRR